MSLVTKINHMFAPSLQRIEAVAKNEADDKFRVSRRDGVDYILFEGTVVSLGEDGNILDRLDSHKKMYRDEKIRREKVYYGY